MGSFIARNYLNRYGSGIQGMIVMGTGNQSKALLGASKVLVGLTGFFCGEKHVAKFINKLAFGTFNRAIEDVKTNVDWLTKDEAIVDKYIADERCGFAFTVNGFRGLFELIYRLHKPKNLVTIPKKIPVFFVSGEEDPVGDYGEGVIGAKNDLVRAGLENVSMKLYPGDRHEILNETDKDIVYQDIYEWLESIK
jgi:alpha-beta hydrolase superfamily lysophospholipase